MQALKVGLIGAGDVAQAHMASYSRNPRVEVVSIADPDIQAAKSLAERHGVGTVSEDHRDILGDPEIAVADLCVPHYLHYPMTMDSLNAGKHVICEKPIAMNLEEADRMIEAAHELGLWLLVVLNQRFLPLHRKVKELLTDGRLGKPFLVNAHITGDQLLLMNDPYSWKGTWDRAGGGAFFEAGVHLVYLMHHWFGEPSAVTAAMKRLIAKPENKADDNAVVNLEYDDDLIVNLIVSYTVENERWSEKKFIYGTGGDLSIISEAAVPMLLISDSRLEVVEVEHNPDWWPYSLDLALRHFVDCIADGAQPVVTDEEARAALKTVLAAYRSAREGRRVEIA